MKTNGIQSETNTDEAGKKSSSEISFLPLYWRGVWDCGQEENQLPRGVISIPGPTGMGKTTTIARELIPKLRPKAKVIYLTHRLRLTADFCNSCTEHLGRSSFRQDRSQKDNLLQLEPDFAECLQTHPFAKLVPKKEREAWFEKLDRQYRQFDSLSNETTRDKGLRKVLDNQTRNLAALIYRQFSEVLRNAPSDERQSVREDYLSGRETPLIEALRCPVVETIFPAIPWQLGGIQILAMTTQKFLKSGINYGVRVCYPDEVHDAIIFVDEFDYQESEILTYLTSRPQVQNPINCLRLLVDGVEKLKKAHPGIFSARSLSLPTDRIQEIRENHPEIAARPLEELCGNPSATFSDWRERVRRVTGKKIAKLLLDEYGENFHGQAIVEQCERIVKRFDEAGIDWQSMRFQLHPSEEERAKQPFVFQSVHLLADWIELHQDDDFWYVQSPPEGANVTKLNLAAFYGTIQTGIQRINGIMTRYRHRQDLPLFSTILKVCFDDANDNSPGIYTRYFNQIYPAGLARSITNAEDNEGERPPDFYTTGYNLHFFEPQDTLEQPNNIASDHLYQVEISPEAIIAGLARKNLIYGLSATNHIRRIINSFDLTWLENELFPEVQDEGVLVRLELDNWQRDHLREMQDTKDKVRGNPLGTYGTATEPDDSAWEEVLKCIRTHLGHQSEFKGPRRIRRLLLFLETLEWIATKSEHNGHLVFVQSPRQVRSAFSSETRHEIPWPDWLIFGDEGNDWQLLNIHNQVIYVVYYNAEFDRRLRSDPDLQSNFDSLFADGRVILLTTQSTIANGANLEHVNEGGDRIDYGGIHILEVPYFAFSQVNFFDDEEDESEDPGEAKRRDCYWYPPR